MPHFFCLLPPHSAPCRLPQALKLKREDDAPGGRAYESAPNYDAQVYFRLQTNGFALLAPIIRPNPKQPELLKVRFLRIEKHQPQ